MFDIFDMLIANRRFSHDTLNYNGNHQEFYEHLVSITWSQRIKNHQSFQDDPVEAQSRNQSGEVAEFCRESSYFYLLSDAYDTGGGHTAPMHQAFCRLDIVVERDNVRSLP